MNNILIFSDEKFKNKVFNDENLVTIIIIRSGKEAVIV